jgi:hypothetical protein
VAERDLMAQVRLDDDVEAALRALADKDGGSLAHHANAGLRRSLGLPTVRVTRTVEPGRPFTEASVAAPTAPRRFRRNRGW